MSEATATELLDDPLAVGAPEQPATLVERVAWSVVFLGVLITGVDFSGDWTQVPLTALLSPTLIAIGILGAAWTWMARSSSMGRLRVVGGLIGGIAALIPPSLEAHARHWFSTDSAALNQLAGEALANGHNPYTSSMAAVDSLLKNPTGFWTYTATGGHVAQVSYPPGSFLLVAPFQALGFHHDVADWVDLAAWGIAALLIYLLLPARVRFIAPLLLLFGGFTGAFGSGGTDALFLPFLVLAAWRWDDFGAGRSSGWIKWMGPVALGLACSIKQGPWFLVPFLVLGTALEAKAAGRKWLKVAATYLGVVAAVFVAIDLPFVLAAPKAWYVGTTLPFHLPLVADGSGIVALALHGIAGGAVLPWLSAAGLLLVLSGLVGFVLWYPAAKRAWLFALPLALAVPGRSLASYLLDYVPVAVVAAVCVAPAPAEGLPSPSRMLRRVALGVPLLLCASAVVISLTTYPLEVSVSSVRTVDDSRGFHRITVVVHNRSSDPARPLFMVDTNGGHPDGFWQPVLVHGSWPIAPGATTTIRLAPRGYASTPDPGRYWIVDAYTTGPESLSVSPLMKWPNDGHDMG